MTENNISGLPINQVYTVLKEKYHAYSAKYSSLNGQSSGNLLALINEELNISNELVQLLDSEILKGLVNPKLKNKADELVKKINLNLVATPDLIEEQFSEFINFSELLFWGCTAANVIFHPVMLQNFASLTKLKFNLFLDNLSQFLQSATKEARQLKIIAEILLNDYFPAIANARYDKSTEWILSFSGTSREEIKNFIEKNDIPALKEKLDSYQKKISRQKETIICTDVSDSDDEDYYSCNEWNETENPKRFDDADNDSDYSCADEDKFFDALEEPLDEASLAIEQPAIETAEKSSKYSIQQLMQRLINWFRKLMHSLGHIMHRTEENPLGTTQNAREEIEEPVHVADMPAIPSCVELEKPARRTTLPTIDDWKKEKNFISPLSKSTGNLHCFYREKNNAAIVTCKPTIKPRTNQLSGLFRSMSTTSVN